MPHSKSLQDFWIGLTQQCLEKSETWQLLNFTTDRDAQKVAPQKQVHNKVYKAQNSTLLQGNKELIPDAIFGLQAKEKIATSSINSIHHTTQNKKAENYPMYYCLEVEHGVDSGKAIAKINLYAQLLASAAPLGVSKMATSPRILFLFQHKSCMQAVIKKVRKTQQLLHLKAYFLFSYGQRNQANCWENWINLDETPCALTTVL